LQSPSERQLPLKTHRPFRQFSPLGQSLSRWHCGWGRWHRLLMHCWLAEQSESLWHWLLGTHIPF